MLNLFSKIRYQYKDFFFNLKLFPWYFVIKYYYNSYFLINKFVSVKIKKKGFENTKFTIRCRNGIDKKVLSYVFFQQFHFTDSFYLNTQNPIILDLGSNIGCTIIDFKIRYPTSIVYGYEMDIDNYNLAVLNCNNFSNVHLFNKAVWVNNDAITYSRTAHTDSYAISKLIDNEISLVNSLTITDILKENNIKRIDFLKMDIEGAEINIFDDLNLSWLDNVYSLNIEFHRINETDLDKYIYLLQQKGFKVWKSKMHWSAIEGIKECT